MAGGITSYGTFAAADQAHNQNQLSLMINQHGINNISPDSQAVMTNQSYVDSRGQ